MANNKVGFSYYSVETDRYQDKKIKRLKKEHSCAGMAVYDYLLSEIYRVKGYYTEFDNDVAFDVADYFGITEEEVTAIVNTCCKVGLFDISNLQKNEILTSESIQKRYIDWSKKSKRTNFFIPEHLAIIQEESLKLPEESPKLQEESLKLPDSSGSLPQSKVKERKEEKRSKKETPEKSAFDPLSIDLPFKENEFKEAWESWAAHRKEIKTPLTEQAVKRQFKLLAPFGSRIAVAMIDKAISSSWKTFFPLKPDELSAVLKIGPAVQDGNNIKPRYANVKYND